MTVKCESIQAARCQLNKGYELVLPIWGDVNRAVLPCTGTLSVQHGAQLDNGCWNQVPGERASVYLVPGERASVYLLPGAGPRSQGESPAV